MEVFLKGILQSFGTHSSSDPILECGCEGLNTLVESADALFVLADQKLHVFPYKDVRPCWFRLYTDTSLVKAVGICLENLETLSGLDGQLTQEDYDLHWVDLVVTNLDMALIMAGGLGRREEINALFSHLYRLLGLDREFRDADTDSRLLPIAPVSVPKISYPLTQLDRPPIDRFITYMHNVRQPAVLTGILQHWPALEKWSRISHWQNVTLGGRRLIPVEVGRSYVDAEWGQKLVPFGDFLQGYILDEHDNPAEPKQTGYLAQHDLMEQIPELYKDFSVPDYCYLDAPAAEKGTPVAKKLASGKVIKTSHPSMIQMSNNTDMHTTSVKMDDDLDPDDDDSPVHQNIWFGPAWTISPLHHDPYHNILCQVVGTKYVRLYSPWHSSRLYPRSKEEPAPHLHEHARLDETTTRSATIDMSNTSSIDVAAMELSPFEDWDDVYPGISQVPYIECILEAGQALYIPIGWWHYVRSCSTGISLSFWW